MARILIVEDERIVAGDLQVRLRALGYEVAGLAPSGEEAMQLAEVARPDLVLMDIRLEGEMDGIETARTIRDRFQIPVIYLSAYADHSTIERAKVTDPSGYLLKPFEDTELRTTIEMALYRRQAEQEQQAMQDQVIQAQKMESIGTLVVGLAHNLNNILAIIMGYASRLERNPDDPQKVTQSVQAINTAVRRGAGLIQQLIGVTARTNLQFASVDVNAFLSDLLQMAAEVFPRSISLLHRFNPDRPIIAADPNQLNQAFLNVLMNARDAMPVGGTVTVTTETLTADQLRGRLHQSNGHDYLRVSISDSGEGMTEETRRHIFEPFFTTRDRAKHAGLGLSVVYGILTGHKGFIDVESTPGRGTTVSLFFPLESRRIYTAVGSQGDSVDLPGGHETILVVEDEEMLRALVKEVLSRAGYVILEAADGEEGVQVFNEQHEHIDLVLLDLGLPKIAGDAVFQEMKLINPRVPVVFSTGYVRKDKAGELLALGARGVVHKPYTVTSMLTTIRSVLDSRTIEN